jgi:hypothetical protein
MMTMIEAEWKLLLGGLLILFGWAGVIASDLMSGREDRVSADVSPVRQWLVSGALFWVLAAVAIGSWAASGRSSSSLGFTSGEGWQVAAAWALAGGLAALQAWQGQVHQPVIVLVDEAAILLEGQELLAIGQ